jgi:large subunit ribosomal protein L22
MIVRSTASLKFVSIPPRKMRLVGALVKGLPVEEALNVLNFTPRIAARHMAKTLKSAAANALSLQGTDHLRPEALVVKSIIVDGGPSAKRIRFQSMGRVFRIKKNYCHLTVHLEGVTDAPPVRPGTAKAKTKAELESGEQAVTEKTTKSAKTSGARAKSKSAAKKKAAEGKKKSGAKSKSKSK